MTTGLTTKVRCVKIQLSPLTFISMEIQGLSKREQGRSLFLARLNIHKVHKNVKKKTLKESIATLEESIFIAKQEGNTKLLRALELSLKALKKKLLSKI